VIAQPELYFEDFAIGDRFVVPSKTMTDAHFLMFSALTGDTHPIHYDVAHGYLVTVLQAMGASNLNFAIGETVIAFLEQSSKMLAPVFIGDTLSPQGEVAELLAKQTNGVVKFATWVANQRGERVVEGTQTYLFKRRSPAES
jgi:acyl dehydratase